MVSIGLVLIAFSSCNAQLWNPTEYLQDYNYDDLLSMAKQFIKELQGTQQVNIENRNADTATTGRPSIQDRNLSSQSESGSAAETTTSSPSSETSTSTTSSSGDGGSGSQTTTLTSSSTTTELTTETQLPTTESSTTEASTTVSTTPSTPVSTATTTSQTTTEATTAATTEPTTSATTTQIITTTASTTSTPEPYQNSSTMCAISENSPDICIDISESASGPSTALRLLLETILDFMGISTIVYSDDTPARKKRQTPDSISASLEDYGCWCSRPLLGYALAGAPLDAMDAICRQWAQCTFCEKFSECEGGFSDDFTLGYIAETDDYVCSASSECARQRCECNGHFTIAAAVHLRDAGGELNAANVGPTPEQCIKGEKTMNHAGNNACCGLAPLWTGYNTDQATCNSDGTVQTL